MNLKYLTDRQLLIDTKNLAEQERKLTAKQLHYFKEIESRKLFCELGYTSMFNYLVQELGYSEGSASRRLNAARLLKEIPEIEAKIESGDLTLSNVAKAADIFKQENITDKNLRKEILSSIENTSTRVCEKTLSELNKIHGTQPPIVHTIYLNEASYEKLTIIKGYLTHLKLNRDQIFARILDVALEHYQEKRFKTNSKQSPIPSESRYIPPGLRKAVLERDKCCVKCGSTFDLEINHIIPFSIGGKTELSNLNLLCRNCNQRAAIESNLHFP